MDSSDGHIISLDTALNRKNQWTNTLSISVAVEHDAGLTRQRNDLATVNSKTYQDSGVMKISVSFYSEVCVREYAVGIVDNSVSSGVPIGLTGDCIREYFCSIHDDNHIPNNNVRSLVISPQERELLLNRQGVTWKEIHRAVQKTNHAVTQRRRKKKTPWTFLKLWRQMITSSLPFIGHNFSFSQSKLVMNQQESSRNASIHMDESKDEGKAYGKLKLNHRSTYLFPSERSHEKRNMPLWVVG